MRRLFRPQTLALILATSFAAMAPQQAEAKSVTGIAIVNTGDDIYPAGELPADVLEARPDLAGLQAGIKCDVFGVFWIMLHQWNCEPVAFDAASESYLDDPTVAALLEGKVTKDDAVMGFMDNKAKWILLLVIIISIVVGMRGDKDEEAPAEA